MLNRARVVIVFAALPAIYSAASALPAYTITEIPTLGGDWSFAYGISENGHVTGPAETAGGRYHAFVYKDGVMTDLGATITNSFGYAVNNSGHVVGRAYQSGGNDIGFLHDGATFRNVGSFGGTWTNAYGINDAGVVVGYSQYPGDAVTRAFAYQDGTMTDLGALAPGLSSSADAINNVGQVAGSATLPGFPSRSHAALFQNGTVTDLGTLGGNNSSAHGINDLGQVVGWSEKSGTSGGGFVYTPGVGMKPIPAFPGGYIGTAYDVNNLGLIVGEAGTDVVESHAFLYGDGATIDLNTVLPAGSGWELLYARGINDAGQIVGYGRLGGNIRGFIMSPVPEPVAAFGYPLLMLALRRNRKAVIMAADRTNPEIMRDEAKKRLRPS